MKKQLIVALLGFSALIFGGAANAIIVSLVTFYVPPPGFTTDTYTAGDSATTYQLVVGDSNADLMVSLMSTISAGHSVTYSLYEDLNASSNYISQGALLQQFSATDGILPSSVTWALLALGNYILTIDADLGTEGTYTNLTNVSPVPLPAAALLFGSALFGAGIFGRKNKATKENDLAAVAVS